MKLLTIEDIVSTGSVIAKDLKILFKKDRELQVLDIGACTGEDSIIYSNLFPNATITAFEPLPGNVEVMKQHLKAYGKEGKVHIESTALSDTEGEFSFYVSGGSPYGSENVQNTTIIPKEWNKSSSLLRPSHLLEKEFPWLEFKEQTVVKTKRLDNYLYCHSIANIDFIHMDVQGAELKVLLGLGQKIKNVKVIWLEVENVALYENQPLKKDIQSYLSRHNFYKAKDTSKGRVAGDCFYIRGLFPFLRYRLYKTILLVAKIIPYVWQKFIGKLVKKEPY
ncbi:FkbM family methyltransferase [Flavisolibacter sp. BT320]|nr:FkbM family methyltransferase [Flavisolibacter longurius]